MMRFVAVLVLLVGCKKSNEAAHTGSGSGSAVTTAAAAGDAGSAVPIADAAVALDAADVVADAAAAAAACAPDAFSNDDPPFCLDIPATYKTPKLQVLRDKDEVNIYRFQGSDDSISIKLDRKATDVAKAAKSAKAIAKAGASDNQPFEMSDITDGKAISYTLCEAEIGCGPSVMVVKKTAVGMYTCESSSQTQDEKWASICKSISGR